MAAAAAAASSNSKPASADCAVPAHHATTQLKELEQLSLLNEGVQPFAGVLYPTAEEFEKWSLRAEAPCVRCTGGSSTERPASAHFPLLGPCAVGLLDRVAGVESLAASSTAFFIDGTFLCPRLNAVDCSTGHITHHCCFPQLQSVDASAQRIVAVLPDPSSGLVLYIVTNSAVHVLVRPSSDTCFRPPPVPVCWPFECMHVVERCGGKRMAGATRILGAQQRFIPSAAIDEQGNIVLRGETAALLLLDLADLREAVRRRGDLSCWAKQPPPCLLIWRTSTPPAGSQEQRHHELLATCTIRGDNSMYTFSQAGDWLHVRRGADGQLGTTLVCDGEALFEHMKSAALTSKDGGVRIGSCFAHSKAGVSFTYAVGSRHYLCAFEVAQHEKGYSQLQVLAQIELSADVSSACIYSSSASGSNRFVLFTLFGSNLLHRVVICGAKKQLLFTQPQLFRSLSDSAAGQQQTAATAAAAATAVTAAAAAVAPYRLVLLCASHLSSAIKCELFGLMLQSVAMQRTPVSLWISQSYAEERLKVKAQKYVQRFLLSSQRSGVQHLFVARKQRYRQFEHLAYLVQRYETERVDPGKAGSDWFTFIDDDDQIGIDRVSTFVRLIQQRHRLDDAASASVTASVKRVFPFVRITCLRPEALPVSTRCQQLLTSLAYKKLPTSGEFVQYCVQLPALKRFFVAAHPSVLCERQCDLLFFKYLTGGPRIPLCVEEEHCSATEYVYWWGVEGQAHRTRAMDVTQHVDLATYLREELVRFIADEVATGTCATDIDRVAFRRFFEVIEHPQAWCAEHDQLLEHALLSDAIQHILALPSAVDRRTLLTAASTLS